MLYEYLEENYKPNEPIFVSDVQLPVSAVNLRKMFKELCDSGKINRFDKGVYYIPKQSRLKGGVPLGADVVARAKYIYRMVEWKVIIPVIHLQINWGSRHKFHMWLRLYLTMPVPVLGKLT